MLAKCGLLLFLQGPLNLMRTLDAVQRLATRYILRGLELDYKQRLLKVSLFPLSYFLEYLDLLFLFRCIKGEIISTSLIQSSFFALLHIVDPPGSTFVSLARAPLLTASRILFVSVLYGMLSLSKWLPVTLFWCKLTKTADSCMQGKHKPD